MNYIQEAEKRLRYYHDLERSIDQINKRLSKLNIHGPTGLSGITAKYEITGIHAAKADDTYNTLYEYQQLVESRERTREEIQEIDAVLNEISVEEDCKHFGPILRMWYIERRPKEDIACEIGYSVRAIYDIRAEAIRKFAVRILGIKALNAI